MPTRRAGQKTATTQKKIAMLDIYPNFPGNEPSHTDASVVVNFNFKTRA